MIEYFLFTSKYRVFGGEYIPKEYCNDAPQAAQTMTDGGPYGAQTVKARGCLAYGKWVAKSINNVKTSNGTDSNALYTFTASALKEHIKKYAQAGETIQVAKMSETPHTVVFISADESGFYYFDFSGYSQEYGKNNTRNFRYATYEKFVTGAKNRGSGIWIGKYIDVENNDDVLAEKINLSSTPSDIGSSFTSTIKCTSTGKLLTADSSNNVVALSSDGSSNQKWKFTKNSDNYYEIENVATGLRLDVYNAGTKDGTNIDRKILLKMTNLPFNHTFYEEAFCLRP